MKFLIDKNLSFKLKFILEKDFPETLHIDNVGLETAKDSEIWEYAGSNGFTILTMDNDFDILSNMFGCPPKIVHLICGNRNTEEICAILITHAKQIQVFLGSRECLLKIS